MRLLTFPALAETRTAFAEISIGLAALHTRVHCVHGPLSPESSPVRPSASNMKTVSVRQAAQRQCPPLWSGKA